MMDRCFLQEFSAVVGISRVKRIPHQIRNRIDACLKIVECVTETTVFV